MRNANAPREVKASVLLPSVRLQAHLQGGNKNYLLTATYECNAGFRVPQTVLPLDASVGRLRRNVQALVEEAQMRQVPPEDARLELRRRVEH